jgi:intracellular multiplication protein IcmK
LDVSGTPPRLSLPYSLTENSSMHPFSFSLQPRLCTARTGLLWCALVSPGAFAQSPPPVAATPPPSQATQTPDMTLEALEAAFRSQGMSDQDLIQDMGRTSPLTPDQIRAIRRHVDAIRAASSAPPGPPPKARVASHTISLESGFAPPTLKMANGLVTSLVFHDNTGAPWPIQNVISGNEHWVVHSQAGSHILTVAPKNEFGYSNLSVLLEGAPAPVILIVEAGRFPTADHRLDFRVAARGPKATTLTLSVPDSAAIPEYLMGFQDNVPPGEAKAVSVTGLEGVRAWSYLGRLIVRTPYAIASPAPQKASRSAEGTWVYELRPTPWVFLLHNGQTHRLSLAL